MNYILIGVVVAFVTAQQVFQKQYNAKTDRPNAFLFTGISSFFALIFFVLSSGFKLNFNLSVLPYSVAFGAVFATSFISLVYALRYGMMSLTSLITAYSLIIPAFYGILFLKEPIKITVYIGIALLLISLLLLNGKSKEDGKFSVKWLIFVFLNFFCNGMCSTIQKMQQLEFDGAYKSEFMIIALLIVTVTMCIFALRQGGVKNEFKKGAALAAFTGIANGVVNLLVMILTGSVPNAILFPSISAGGIILSFIISTLIYKEHLTKNQIAGYIIGTFTIILLNL